jgi:hypothetical protein
VTDGRTPKRAATGRTVTIGTLRLRVHGVAPATAVQLARDIAGRLALQAGDPGWMAKSGLSLKITPSPGQPATAGRIASDVGAALQRKRKGAENA